MTGEGLLQVRQRVQKAFEDARREPATTTIAHKSSRPLCEIVVPLFKLAARPFNAAPYARHLKTHLIVVPKGSAEELFAECERAVARLGIPRARR